MVNKYNIKKNSPKTQASEFNLNCIQSVMEILVLVSFSLARSLPEDQHYVREPVEGLVQVSLTQVWQARPAGECVAQAGEHLRGQTVDLLLQRGAREAQLLGGQVVRRAWEGKCPFGSACSCDGGWKEQIKQVHG